MMNLDSSESAEMNSNSSFQAQIERTWGNPSWRNLIVILPFVVFVILGLYELRANEITAAREQTSYALIVSHDAPNHNRFGYQFGVNGKMYKGWAIPSARDYEIGQRVVVYYDPLNPDKSQLDDFANNGNRIIGPVSLCLFGICTVSLYIFLRRRAIGFRRTQPGLDRRNSPSGDE